jgi:hypothetical protein
MEAQYVTLGTIPQGVQPALGDRVEHEEFVIPLYPYEGPAQDLDYVGPVDYTGIVVETQSLDSLHGYYYDARTRSVFAVHPDSLVRRPTYAGPPVGLPAVDFTLDTPSVNLPAHYMYIAQMDEDSWNTDQLRVSDYIKLKLYFNNELEVPETGGLLEGVVAHISPERGALIYDYSLNALLQEDRSNRVVPLRNFMEAAGYMYTMDIYRPIRLPAEERRPRPKLRRIPERRSEQDPKKVGSDTAPCFLSALHTLQVKIQPSQPQPTPVVDVGTGLTPLCSVCETPILHAERSACTSCGEHYCSELCQRWAWEEDGHEQSCGLIAARRPVSRHHSIPSAPKAREMLAHPPHNRELTPRQFRFFQWAAHRQ